MKKNFNHINVVNAQNPVRMGFYIPGYGVATKVRDTRELTPAEFQKKMMETAKNNNSVI